MAEEFYDARGIGQNIIGAAGIIQRREELAAQETKIRLDALATQMQNPDNSPFQNFSILQEISREAGLPEPNVDEFNKNQAGWQRMVEAAQKDDAEAFITELGNMPPGYIKRYAEMSVAKQKGLAVKGYKQLAERGGLEQPTEAEGAAIAESPQMQAGIASQVFPGPEKTERARLLKMKADQLSLQDNQLSLAQADLGGLATSLVPDVSAEIDYMNKVSRMSETARKSQGLRNAALTGTNAMRPQERQRALEIAKQQLQEHQSTRRGLMEVLNKQQMGVPGFEGDALQTKIRLHSLDQTIQLRQAEVAFLTAGTMENLKKMQGVQYNIQQQLYTLKEARKNVQQQMADTSMARLGLAENKEAFEQQKGKAHAFMSQQYLNNLDKGMDDTKAATAAVNAAREQFPGAELHPEQLKNPAKTGTLKLMGEKAQSDLTEAMTYLDQMDDIMKTFKPQYVGKLDNVINKYGQMTASLSEEREQFLQDLRAFKQGIRHSAFGGALTPQELERALSEIPDESMGDKQFKASMNSWQKKWTAVIRNRMIAAGQAAGKRSPAKASKSVAGAEDFIKKMTEAGYSQEEVEAFLATRSE